MRFVDEQDHRRGGGLDLFDDATQTVFELALDAGARFQCTEIQAEQTRVFEEVGDFVLADQQRQTLHHGGLAHTRFAHGDGVVFTPPGKDVDHLANLIIAPENRVDTPRRCLGGQVFAKARDIVFGGGRIAAGAGQRSGGRTGLQAVQRTFTGAAQQLSKLRRQGIGGNRLEQFAVACTSGVVTQARYQRQQQRTTADAPGADHQRGNQPGVLNPLGEQAGEHWTSGVAVFQLRQALIQQRTQAHRIDFEAREDARRVGIRIFQQLAQQVLQGNLVVSPRQGLARRVLQGLGAVHIEPCEQRFEFYLNHLASPLFEHWSVFGRQHEYNVVLCISVTEPGIQAQSLPAAAQRSALLFIGRKAHDQAAA